MRSTTPMSRLPPPLPRNPETQSLHRRDVTVQIQLPLMIALIGALTVLAFVFGATPAGRSVWADVSLILLIVIGLGLSIAPLALIVGFLVGLWYVIRYLPGYAKIAQDFMRRVAGRTAEYSDRVTRPVIATHSAGAAVGGALGLGTGTSENSIDE
ncbi:MAG: hypothetical protein HY023_07935 [Chloroflexi bacterium]|nr:hypothetical protein [Chloroflexota bacterium]MBI3763629.1 hypothetical protein [Chloroflexota bacterium]